MPVAGRLIRTSRLVIVIAMILLVQGCTNSKLIIGPLYNRLDDRMRDEFNKLGDFNAAQTAAFEARLGTYHVWHRQSELPQYAELLTDVAQSISAADITEQDIQQWFDTAEQHSSLVRECHPVNFSFELMQSLTDDQLIFIENRFKREQQKNRKRRAEGTPEERRKRRLRNMVKWAGRIGLELTPTQRSILLDTFNRQTSLRSQYYSMSGEWNRKFFSLARAQNNPNYDRDMSAHLGKLWRLLEAAYPQQWQANRDLWKQTTLRIAQSLTNEQRVKMSAWLKKMGSTLDAISRVEPSFKVVDDASLGCMVDPEET